MSRPKGSIIGARPTWTTTATSGIWTLRQAEEMKAGGNWPRGPVAPTSLAGTAGDGQVALTWTAPATTHGTITDYLVEYTAAGDPFFSSVSLLAPLDSDTNSVVGGVTPTVSGTAMTISPSDGKYSGHATNTVATSTTAYATSFGNGDWTVECWIRRDSLFSTNPRIIDLGAVELEPGTSSTINFYYRPTDTNFSSSTFLTTQGQWHHVAIVYQSGVLRSYVDGVQRGSITQSVTPPTSVQLTNTCSFDDLRVTAAAVYPDGTTFTPPTSAHATSGSGSPTVVATGSTAASYTLTGLTNDTEYTFRVAAVNHTRGDWSDSVAVTPSTAPTDPDFASVSLLLHMDGSNGSTTFTDSSSNAFTVTRAGNAQISTAQSKFGGSSGYFDGTGDYLETGTDADFNFGTGDFTIEAWVRLDSLNAERAIVAKWSQSGEEWLFRVESNNRLKLFAGGGSVTGSSSLSSGVWYHVAVARSSGTTRLFLNGTQDGSATVTSNLTGSTAVTVGDYFPFSGQSGVNPWNGYIDDLRITKGVARYTANFTPPTAAFPDQ